MTQSEIVEKIAAMPKDKMLLVMALIGGKES